MSTEVKWLHSGMEGAPVLTGNAGSLVALLQACLIDGFNVKAVDALTYDEETGEATVTITGGHGYKKHQIILIAGADQTGYNGEHRVTYVDSTTLRFALDEAPAATPATGSITIKTAPVGGWERAFDNGTLTKAAFRSTHPASTGCLLRVDDSHTKSGWNSSGRHAVWEGYESMTDVDTGEGLFFSGWARKDYTTSGTNARDWVLVGDSLIFYVCTYPYVLSNATALYSGSFFTFGDIISYRPGDGFHCAINAAETPSDSSTNECTSDFGYLFDANQHGRYIARGYAQFPGGVACRWVGSRLSAYMGYGGSLIRPNPADNALYFHKPILVVEGSTSGTNTAVRGEAPGVIQALQYTPYPHLHVQEGLPADPDALLLAVTCGTRYSQTYEGQAIFDIRGPWR